MYAIRSYYEFEGLCGRRILYSEFTPKQLSYAHQTGKIADGLYEGNTKSEDYINDFINHGDEETDNAETSSRSSASMLSGVPVV